MRPAGRRGIMKVALRARKVGQHWPSNWRYLRLVINQPPGHSSSSSSSSHEASGTDNGDEIQHRHWCGLFITSHFHSALPAGRPHAFPSLLVRLQSSSLPSNRPTLPICLDTSTHTARLAAVYSEVRSVAQAACTAPESCLSGIAWVGACQAGRGLRQSYCNMKSGSI